MRYHFLKRFALLAALQAAGLPSALAQEVADKIYSGGPVLTMEDSLPQAEAVAVKNGKILAVGASADLEKHKGANTELVDLGGQTMIPGFVDAHGHVFMVGFQAKSANLLPAPDGQTNDIPALQKQIQDWMKGNEAQIKSTNLIPGFGYDDSQLSEQRHPTRDDLDAVSRDTPIYIIHQSGHLGVANSKALEIVGYTARTKDMPGGVIRRDDKGNPTGVLEETAHFEALVKLTSSIDAAGAEAMFLAGTDMAKSYGYTTAQEGRAMPGQVKAMEATAAAGKLEIDVTVYPDVLVDRDMIKEKVSRDYTNRLRVVGAKLTIDGSPQGFTAWRDRPYYNPPENYRADYAGFSAATSDEVFDAIDWAFENDIQILTHSNGEAASDLLLAAIQTAEEKHGRADRRPVLIHGQFLREDQVDRAAALKVFPSLFPMHTFYWGDWHRDRTVGPELADNISPTGWFRKRGLAFSSHHDAPVALPDSMRILSATVTRRSRSGDIIGPDQRVDVVTALKAMTIWPAYQHFEEDTKGSIAPGKLADFVILSDNPTAIDPEKLHDIKVMETIKEGNTIYTAPPASGE
ncbi:amidohydrolase [Labrenzia sp. 011]|uniref:amidohydrolase n=1 Tax=Labrenzia sp. 011 TaxID=2171494 RepID=UPI000D5062CD|nr:amidohydrolase [Labrenzia sp. 011]PVB62296.1 amidohydrolase [Labrenzia sp. 011]